VPSVFVTKLFQMVNGSPDDVVSWVPSGDAFLIQNLSRLEEEALPLFFRHARFQSLVRQLNFYNFRKINRERTFWVYRHPLFHRDRPQDLHLLKRRSVLGGKQLKRTSSSTVEKHGYFDPNQSFDDSMETESLGASSCLSSGSKKDSPAGKLTTPQRISVPRRPDVLVLFSDPSADLAANKAHPQAQKFCDNDAPKAKIIPFVSQKMQQHGFRAPNRPCFNTSYTNTSTPSAALITPPQSSTFKFNDAASNYALKVEHEIKQHAVQKNGSDIAALSIPSTIPTKCGVVTDSEDTSVENEASAIYSPVGTTQSDRQAMLNLVAAVSSSTSDSADSNNKTAKNSSFKLLSSLGHDGVSSEEPSKKDSGMVAVVHQKILGSAIYDSDDETSTSAAICKLLMSTNPCDSDLRRKVALLMNTCSVVEREFKRYCIALFPHLYPTPHFMLYPRNHHLLRAKHSEKDASYLDAEFDRIFTSFAIHWMEGLVRLASNPRAIVLDENEKAALKHSAETWFGSLIASH